MTLKKNDVIKVVLKRHSGEIMMSKEISAEMGDDSLWGLSNKSVGRRLMVLADEGWAERIKHDPAEANVYQCRYSYRWVPKGEVEKKDG